jgi:4-amino-4-deoxy-L-arabinose transferase-like glycosyltransferase
MLSKGYGEMTIFDNKTCDLSNKISNLFLAGILLAAFIMRFKGIWFGYPLLVHPDEGVIVGGALNILKTHNLHPIRFDYPSLNFYIQSFVYFIFIVVKKITGSAADSIKIVEYYLVGRTVTVLFSVATIYVVYAIGKLLFNNVIGIIAALVICMANLHVANSYMITVDNTTAFWSALSALMAIKLLKSGGKGKYYLLSGACAGCAMGCKYTALFAVLPMIVAHIQMVKGKPITDWLDKNIILGVLTAPIVFLITTPYAILDYDNFIKTMAFMRLQYTAGHSGAESSGNSSLLLYVSALTKDGYGIGPTLFAIIGLLVLLVKDRWQALLLLVFPLALLLYVGQYKTFFLRNVVAMIPFMALFTSIAIYYAANEITAAISKMTQAITYNSIMAVVLSVCTVCVVAPPAMTSVRQLVRKTLPDTRWIATKWILDNYKSKLKVGREWYTPPIEEYSTNFSVTNLECGKVVQDSNARIVSEQDYVVLSSDVYDRFVKYPDKYPEMAEGYSKFFANHKLVKEFTPDWKTVGGPTIRIYKIENP